jgi:hypothetical protein
MAQNRQDDAFAFLGTVRKKDLSVLESAVLLQALSGAHRSHRVTQRLFAQLKEICTEDWIRANPLATVFAVANALHFYDDNALHGRHIGVLAQRLMASEKTPGGPYAEPGTEPDAFTNVLIALFAAWAAGTLPGTHAFLQQSVNNGLHAPLVPDSILQRYITLIEDFRTIEIQWPSSVDSVFAAAALLWEPAFEAEDPADDNDTTDATVFAFVAKELSKLGPLLDQQGTTMLDRIKQANKQREITLLPKYFQSALLQVTESNVTRLGIANVYCWLSYMTYDHMLDDGKGIELLPLANIAQRKALSHYRSCVPEAESLVEATFTHMDQANAWEQAHARATVHDGVLSIARLPDYGNGHHLAVRSFAHVLGPLLIAIGAGHQLRSEPLQTLRTAFLHYLIARQLNDDAHDWQDDIASGQLTFVVTRLLRAQNITNGECNLAQTLPRLQQLFRESISLEIAEIMIAHSHKAKELFQQSGLLKSDTMLDQLCDNLEGSAQSMISLSKESEDLLTAF